jgi:osmoprotectant transport system substrate-binding protein
MRLNRVLALGAVLAVLVSACSLGGGSKPTVKIGSVGFDEARVIAEAYAQALEANGYAVDRAGIGLGTRSVVAPAIESGQIELQPEYIGSRLGHEITSGYTGSTGPTGDSATNHSALQAALAGKNLTVLNFTPGIDTNAFVVRQETAEEFDLTTLADAAAVQDQLSWGLALDCPTNALCGAPGGALEQYGITQETIAASTLLAACDTPMADALEAGTIDVAELCSTQPDILVNGWVTLEDNLMTQPADNVAPIVRNDLLSRVSDRTAFEKILNDVSAKIDTVTMATLYKQVSVDRRDVADVAREFLQANNLIPASSAPAT